MKNTKTCPKCAGHEILRVEDVVGERGVNLVLGFFSSVQVARYVCCDCGYAESWVDKFDLKQLKEKLAKQKEKET